MKSYIRSEILEFKTPLIKRPTTDLIILHHIEGNLSLEQTHELHLGRGHKGIDYNIYIALDGTAWWGRGLEYEGGSVLNSGPTKGMNQRAVGIVCNGDFNRMCMPEAQKHTLMRVVSDVVAHYGFASVEQIKGHGEVGYTDCPGRYFPLKEVRDYVYRGGNSQPLPEPELPDTQNPVIKMHSAEPLKNEVMQVDLVAKGVGDDIGVVAVEFRLYPKDRGRSALKCVPARQNANQLSRWARRVNVGKLFGGRRGKYVVRVRAYDAAGNYSEDYKNFVCFTI